MSNGSVLLYLRADEKRSDAIAQVKAELLRITETHGFELAIWPDNRSDVQLIVAVGGDGTFLDASHEALDRDVPIVGVNVGRLGFLTEIQVDELDEIEQLFQGVMQPQQRIVLKVAVKRDSAYVFEAEAVNEISFARHIDSPIIDFLISFDQMKISAYKADGMVIATPTGSTAYNLSLNGPILFPTEHSIVINAMAPHALTHRPIVLPSSRHLDIAFTDLTKGTLSIDGRKKLELQADDRIEVSESPRSLKYIPSHRRNFFDILSEKLHFGRRD